MTGYELIEALRECPSTTLELPLTIEGRELVEVWYDSNHEPVTFELAAKEIKWQDGSEIVVDESGVIQTENTNA